MKKKLLATMAVVPLLGTFGATGVLAATTKAVVGTEDINGTTSTPTVSDKEVTVTVTQDSTFMVVIPKNIELDKGAQAGEYNSNYTVEVTGDIAGDEKVVVTPEEKAGISQPNANGKVNVEMKQSGKDDVIAVVDQQDTDAHSAELLNSAQVDLTGTVTATGVTAGSWLGTFNFDINLTK